MNTRQEPGPGRGPGRGRGRQDARGGRRGPEDHGRAPHARELAASACSEPDEAIAAYKAGARAQARRRRRARQPGAAATGAAAAPRTRSTRSRCSARALRVNPKNPQSWYQLATLYLDLGRLDEARSQPSARRSPPTPRWAPRYNGLGAIAFERGRPREGGDAACAQALALEPRLRTGALQPRRASARRAATPAAAEALYREELETYPDNGRARFNLAQLRRGARRPRRATWASSRRASRRRPSSGACYFYLAREELGAGRLDAAARPGARAGSRRSRAPKSRRSATTCSPTSTAGAGRRARPRTEAAKGRKLEAALRKNPAPRL